MPIEIISLNDPEVKMNMRQEKNKRPNAMYIKHICNYCGELVDETSEDYVKRYVKRSAKHLSKKFDEHLMSCEKLAEMEEKTFLSNPDLADLPENLNQAGFKNVFVIDENTDFSKLKPISK